MNVHQLSNFSSASNYTVTINIKARSPVTTGPICLGSPLITPASCAVLPTMGMDRPGSTSQTARPTIPQKKRNIGKKLEDALRSEDEAVEMKDIMAMDLLSKEDDLEEALEEARKLKKQIEEQSIQLLEQKQRQSVLVKGKASAPPERESTAKL